MHHSDKSLTCVYTLLFLKPITTITYQDIIKYHLSFFIFYLSSIFKFLKRWPSGIYFQKHCNTGRFHTCFSSCCVFNWPLRTLPDRCPFPAAAARAPSRPFPPSGSSAAARRALPGTHRGRPPLLSAGPSALPGSRGPRGSQQQGPPLHPAPAAAPPPPGAALAGKGRRRGASRRRGPDAGGPAPLLTGPRGSLVTHAAASSR